MKIIKAIPPKIKPKQPVAIDTEWFGIEQNKIHRPGGKFACLTVCFEPGIVYLIQDPNDVAPTLQQINDGLWIIHNAKFDITHLRAIVDIPPRALIVDTMLMEQILFSGYYNFFGLEHLARRYLHIELDKSTQEEFITATTMSPEMLEYSARDADVLLRIWFEQRKIIKKSDLNVWKKADRPALWAILDFMGFRLDVDAWRNLAENNKQRQLEIDAELPINPRSHTQVKKYLRKNGFKRLPDTGEKRLKKYIRKYPDTPAAEIAKKILASRTYGKRASTYGMNFIEKFLEKEDDGIYVIHADYRIIGAETGRISCRRPNMQNIPARDTKEFRKCLIARPGNKLIIADYSQQEVGIGAYISGDEKLIEAFNSGKDVYIQTAKIVFGKEIIKSDPLRKGMKAIMLGIVYGLTPYGLAENEDMSIDDAERSIHKILKTFSGLDRWQIEQRKTKTYTKTVLGRKSWLNPYSNQCERNALNNPVQGTGVDMLKAAMGKIHQEWSFDYPYAQVATIHDELVFDVPAEITNDAANLIKSSMESVANELCPGMKFRVGVDIGNTWAEK